MRLGSLVCAVGLAAITAAHAADSKTVPAAAPAAPHAAATPAPVKPITGKVKGPDGKPGAGATVRAIPMPPTDAGIRRGPRFDLAKAAVTKTDASGAFQLQGPGRGPFSIRVELPGAAPAGAVDVPAGAALDLHLKRGAVVVGRVLDLTTQKPIAGAAVTALERDGARFGTEAAHTATTADDGTFQLADCGPGVVVVEAIAPGKARARLDGVIARLQAPDEERKPEANTLFLQPGGRIAGRVLGPDGKPVAEAIVTATPSDGSLFAMLRDGRGAQRTEADGKFAFDGIVAGNRYTVRATKEGLASQDEGPIPIDAGTDRSDLEMKLDTGASLRFRLLTAQDAPVKDVEARLQPQGGRRRSFGIGANAVDHDKIVAEGDGKFLIKSLDVGTFDLTLEPPDFADIAKEGVKLRSGETTDLGTLRVKESKSIAGRIADTNGQPIAGASISGLWLAGEARLSREAISNADGRFKLAGLGDEPLRNLTVHATGYTDASREGAVPGDTAVDFTLEKTGSIVGRVQLAGGAVPQAFRVQAFPEAKEKQERPGFRMVISSRPDEDRIFTDPSGKFRLDGVDAGMVTITAKADGKAPGRKSGLKVAPEQVVDAGTLILEDGRALRGRVVAAKDDAPVPGATISVAVPQGFMMTGGRDAAGVAISGLDGRFEIAGLEPRTYGVDATQPDYSPNSGRVEIGADADTEDFVIKLSRGGTITGLVRDAQKQVLPNVQVLLTKMGMGGGPQAASTGPDGRYSFEKIAPGEYMVIRAPTGGGPVMLFGGMKQVTVREGETTSFDLDESSKINLTGRVMKAGQPVGNAMLFFVASDPAATQKDLRQSHTDADGRYQIGLDTAGAYAVRVSTGTAFFGGGASAINVQVPDQPSPVVDITMKTAGISGHVTNSQGKPVSGAVVTVTAAGAAAGGDGHKRGMQNETEPDGSFLVDGLEAGTYAVTVAAAGYQNAVVPPVTIANDSDVPAVDVRLEAGRTVRGRVVDANGNGIAGAMVVAAASGAQPSARDAVNAASDVNGTFLVTAPADGPIDVTAVAAGFPPARAIGVQPQEGEDIVLRAPRPGRVRVSVVDPNGPVAGARVSCRAVPDYLGGGYLSMMNLTAPTAADGTTTVSSLAPGSYELTASAGSKHASAAATLAEGGEVVTTITLP
jgi:carboxypeptidase family protein